MLKFITDRDIYEKVICGRIDKVRKFLWIATSNLKDLHVDKGGRMVPFLEILSGLVKRQPEKQPASRSLAATSGGVSVYPARDRIIVTLTT